MRGLTIWGLNMLEVLLPKNSNATISVAAALMSIGIGAAGLPIQGPAKNARSATTLIKSNEQWTSNSGVIRASWIYSAFEAMPVPRQVSRKEDAVLRKAAIRSARLVSKGRLVVR